MTQRVGLATPASVGVCADRTRVCQNEGRQAMGVGSPDKAVNNCAKTDAGSQQE